MPDYEADLFTGLTDHQQAAVGHLDGPLLVLAGPGSGKTTVVTRRVARLVQMGIPPWQILALTFTNKAAGEMRDRIDQQLPSGLPGRSGMVVSTFHAFCARLLRREAGRLGISDRYTIYDSAEQRAAAKAAIKAADLSERNFTPAGVLNAISAAKNQLVDARTYASEAFDFHSRAISRAYTAYQKVMADNDALDFDDLLMLTADLLRSHDDAREALQERFQYLLIDEYQDTNHAQFTIAHELAARDRNICVVGDPDQSIYGWRGADVRNILDFQLQYPEAVVVPLGRNFRSTAAIVRCADALIRNNQNRPHKPLSTELPEGHRPILLVCSDERSEAREVAAEFKRRRREDLLEWRDMAVLYRMNALSRVLEEAFRNEQIPYIIARGTAFYERKEIKDALSYLRLVVNPSDEIALRRILNVPARGIGKTTTDRIDGYAAQVGRRFIDVLAYPADVAALGPRAVKSIQNFVSMVEGWRRSADAAGDQLLPITGAPSLAALVEEVIRDSGLEKLYKSSLAEEDQERFANLEELVSAAADFVPEVDFEPDQAEALEKRYSVVELLGAFLESIALVSDADAIDPERGAVTLMTLHAAKGLEFEVVSVVGLENGLLPHHRAASSEEEMEEERRLCFVGITRAKRHLLLSRAKMRTHRGLREFASPSPFLEELPPDDVQIEDRSDGQPNYEPFPEVRTLARGGSSGGGGGSNALSRLFPVGCRVRHPQFGAGSVLGVQFRPVGASACINFDDAGPRTLVLEYAQLERIG